MSNVLGVDLGAISSAGALLKNDKVDILGLYPSQVYFSHTNGTWLLHNDANLMEQDFKIIKGYINILGQQFDELAIKSVLQSYEIKDNENIPKIIAPEGRTYYPEEFVAMDLYNFKEKLFFNSHTLVEHVVLTIESIHINVIESLIESAAIAGLNVDFIISEPLAVLCAYLDLENITNNEISNINKKLFIIDIGSKSFKTYIVDLKQGDPIIKSNICNTLNCNDFNTYIYNYLVQKNKSDLKNNSETIKLGLYDYNNTNEKYLSILEFESLINHELKKIIYEIKCIFRKESLSFNDIDDVIFVGGSCKLPCIQKTVESLFKSIYSKCDPEYIIAHGAAAFTKYDLLHKYAYFQH